LNPNAHCDGERAGSTADGCVGTPMCSRIRSIVGASRTNAMIHPGTPHFGHFRGRHS
jgi:hypothetical protein